MNRKSPAFVALVSILIVFLVAMMFAWHHSKPRTHFTLDDAFAHAQVGTSEPVHDALKIVQDCEKRGTGMGVIKPTWAKFQKDVWTPCVTQGESVVSANHAGIDIDDFHKRISAIEGMVKEDF